MTIGGRRSSRGCNIGTGITGGGRSLIAAYEQVIQTLDRDAAEIQKDTATLLAKLKGEGQAEEYIRERMDAYRIQNETVLGLKQIALLLRSAKWTPHA